MSRWFLIGVVVLTAMACGATVKGPTAADAPLPSTAAAAASSRAADAGPTHAYDCGGHAAKPGDSDGDDVPDAIDACPCAPGVAHEFDPPNVKGCPFDAAPRPHPSPQTVTIMLEIPFAPGASVVSATGEQALEGLRAALQGHPEITLVGIHGHADAREAQGGGADVLSQARAESVRAWFVKRGVDGHRLIACGYGAHLPRDSDATDDGRQRNRRVEFRVYADGGEPPPGGVRECWPDGVRAKQP